MVRDFMAAWNRKDIDGVMGFFAPDAIYHNMPGDPVAGIEPIRAVIEGYATPADAIDWVLMEVAETAGGVVLTERLDKFDFGGKWLELPVMGTFELGDGKITAWRDYFDMATFGRQMTAIREASA
ncbi:MAG: SnoaL-like domain-containing protein [Dehalococcoidia bacterium]|nr:SnoaL-like domain-containing protein [Dehalococcoidia bacterium]